MNNSRLCIMLLLAISFIHPGCEDTKISVSQNGGGAVYEQQQPDDDETNALEKEDTTKEDISAESGVD